MRSRQMNSETRDAVIQEKYIFTAERTTTEDINNTDHDHDRYGNLVKGNTLPDECLPNNSCSEEELKWSLYVPRKQGDSKLERREDEESDDKTLAHLGLGEINCCGSNPARRQRILEERSTWNDNGFLLATPLTTNSVRPQPCVELHASEQHLVRPSLTCDRQSNVADDVVDSTFNHEMVVVDKNELPHNVTDISCHEGPTKVPLQLQDHPSSSAYTKSPFQGGEVVADGSPKHPDYAANPIVAGNTIREIERNTKTSFASATSLRTAHEINRSYKGPLEDHCFGVGRCGGLKGGRKDQSSKTWDRRDTLKRDDASSHKGAKLKEKGQLDSDIPSNTMRVDKAILSERVGESDFSGIRPFFLARHTDDTSMSMTSDTWSEENTEDRPADILSRYQRFGCYPDRCYHSRSTCPPQLLLPKGTECYTGAQVLPPILGSDPAMVRSLALTNGNEQRPQTYNFDNEPEYAGWNPCSGIYPSNSNVSIRNLPPPPPLPSPPCGESKYHGLLDDDLSNGGFQTTAPQAVSTASNTLFAQTRSSTSQVVATTRPENTGLGLSNNVINQTDTGLSGFSVNPTSTIENVIRSQAESTTTSEGSKRKQREPERVDRETAPATVFTNDESSTMHPVLRNGNSLISDDESLAALERRVAEACSLVERVLKEREEKEKVRKEREQRQREERARRELQEQERRETETRESMQRDDNGEGTSTGSEEGAPSERAALPDNPQWLCEHYQRLCRVKFPCCGKFYPCHRCHNNSDECQNDNCKAKEAFYIECSVCRHQQAVRKSSVILLLFSETSTVMRKCNCCSSHEKYPILRPGLSHVHFKFCVRLIHAMCEICFA